MQSFTVFSVSADRQSWSLMCSMIRGERYIVHEVARFVDTVELVQSHTWVFRHPTKIYCPKVFLLTKIKPEYSDILYNPTHFPGPLVCRIRQVLTSCTIRHISLVHWCVILDCVWHPVQSNTFPLSIGVLF